MTNTNKMEAVAATAATATSLIADTTAIIQLLIAVATLAWWFRLWWKNPNQPPPTFPPEDNAPSPRQRGVDSRLLCIVFALLPACFLGCASQRITLLEEKPDGTRKQSTITTRTFWDAKSELAKTKTTNTEKTQSIGTDGAESSSDGTNTVAALKEIRAIIGK